MLARLSKFSLLLYAALSIFANPVLAEDIEALRVGDMKKLVLHKEAKPREEMGSLDRLEAALGSPDFEVVAIATGRNPLKQIKKFFKDEKIENLEVYRDPKSTLARQMGVLGLPITVVLNPDGEEIARLRGDAEWDADEAKAILQALMAKPAG